MGIYRNRSICLKFVQNDFIAINEMLINAFLI